jgi:hypothetical protein
MAIHGTALKESGTGFHDLDESCIKRLSKTRPWRRKNAASGPSATVADQLDQCDQWFYIAL